MTSPSKTLVRADHDLVYNPDAIDAAAELWAKSRTNPETPRYHDLINDKVKAVRDFFEWAAVHPALVTPVHVGGWRDTLKSRKLSEASIYAAISRISSFYRWAMKDRRLKDLIHDNPVNLARPTAPRPYDSDKAKALSDDEMNHLLAVVKERANTESAFSKAGKSSLTAKRDYAMLLMYFTTGMRREEVASIRWKDVRLAPDKMEFTSRVKGGQRITRQIDDAKVVKAIWAYLKASGRKLTPNSPLWARHNRGEHLPDQPVTSRAISENLKRYGKLAGINDIHLHQTRHTFARIVADDTGSLTETQDALLHSKPETTRVYVQRIGVKKDKHSSKITSRMKD